MRATTLATGLLLFLGFARELPAQDLVPRAYVITPVHSNAVVLTYTFLNGAVLFDPSAPITGASGSINVPSFSIYHALNFFGRSANFTATLPYAEAHFHALVSGSEVALYRSGLTDMSFRLAVNLFGGPAMDLEQFRAWKQKRLLGASLKVIAPTGQYDPTKLVNNGSNRWAFKPEFGYSHRRGHWIVDAYAAVWFFTTNQDYFDHNAVFPGSRTQTQAPIGAFEGHFSYDIKPRFWLSLDSNFWVGGRTTVGGIENLASLQRNSRIGGTASVPLTAHQSVKVSYSHGTYVKYGGDYQNVSVGWQYSWLGHPF